MARRHRRRIVATSPQAGKIQQTELGVDVIVSVLCRFCQRARPFRLLRRNEIPLSPTTITTDIPDGLIVACRHVQPTASFSRKLLRSAEHVGRS